MKNEELRIEGARRTGDFNSEFGKRNSELVGGTPAPDYNGSSGFSPVGEVSRSDREGVRAASRPLRTIILNPKS